MSGPGRQPARLMVAILTLNEARRLPACLAAIPAAYRVMVMDSGSTDATIDIARAAGAQVLGNPWPGFAAQRNLCLDACRGLADWVLFIDADEIFPPEFFAWLEATLAGPTAFDVVQVPCVLFWQDRPLRHAPGYPIHHPRLVRVETVRFVSNGTGHGETVAEPCCQIRCPVAYDHYFYDGDLAEWMRKHVGLAWQEVSAEMAGAASHVTARARLNRRAGRGAWRIPARFLYHYVWMAGFRDGWAGFAYALIYAWYEATKWTLRRVRRRP